MVSQVQMKIQQTLSRRAQRLNSLSDWGLEMLQFNIHFLNLENMLGCHVGLQITSGCPISHVPNMSYVIEFVF